MAKEHLDFSKIDFPDVGNEEEDHYQERLSELGLDKIEFKYQEKDFNQIKRLSEYDRDTYPELKYWLASGLDLSIFDEAIKVPRLGRLELFRYGYGNHLDMTPFIKYQNEINDDVLKDLLLVNLYYEETDNDGQPILDEDGMIKYQTLDIPENDKDRETYFDEVKEQLIILAYDNIKEKVKEHEIFSKGYSKELIDKILIGFSCRIDIFEDVNKIIELGVFDEEPDEETLNKMLDKKLEKFEDVPDIDMLYRRIVSAFIKSGKLEIVKAKDLILISEEESQAEKDSDKEQQEESEEKVIVEDGDAEDGMIIDNPQENQSIQLDQKERPERLAFLASQGGINPQEISDLFDTEINRLKLLKEAILRSIKK